MRTAFLAAPVAKLLTVIGISIYLLGLTVAAVFACFLLLRNSKQPALQATALNTDAPKRFRLGSAALLAAQAFFIVAAVLAAAYSPNGMWFNETSSPATAGALLSCLLAPIAYWIMQKTFRSKKTTDIARIYILLVSVALMALFIVAPQLSSFEGGLLYGLAQLSAAIAFDTIILLLMEGSRQPLWISLAAISVYSFVVFAVIVCVFNGYSLDIFSVVAGIAYFLLLAAVVLASIKEPSELKTTDADATSTHQAQSDALRGACDRLSQRFGLTQRENEVLYLLASGRSRSFIEEELVISSGTAKTHIGNIYKKMDIHSKQDLISLARKEAQ